MPASFSNTQMVCGILKFQTLLLLVPYFDVSVSLNCFSFTSFWIFRSFSMVNTKSGAHTSGPEMVESKRKVSRLRDVSLVVPPPRINIHGVRM